MDGSIRNRDFKDGTLRGNEAKRNGFGGGAIKESSLDASQLRADDIGKVKNTDVKACTYFATLGDVADGSPAR